MRPTRICLVLASVAAAATTPLSAQQFDGVMQFVSYDNHPDHPDTMTQITKGSKIRFEGMGKSGGAMIMNGNTRLMLITDQKKYMEMPANLGAREAGEEASKHHGTAEKTGKTETIAGIPCEDWHYKGTKADGSAEEGEACVAKGAGMMVNRLSGGMAGNYFSAGGQAFADAMKSGAGIMKVTNNGKVIFVAVKAQATSVPDAMFAPPPDYTKMDMGSMRGPPRKP
jgi:Domain of unknown function (DUF4412)